MSCDVKDCSKASVLQYEAFGPGRKRQVGVCEYHWEKHCDEEDKFDLIGHFYLSQVDKRRK